MKNGMRERASIRHDTDHEVGGDGLIQVLVTIVEHRCSHKFRSTRHFSFRQHTEEAAEIRITMVIDQYFGCIQGFQFVLNQSSSREVIEIQDGDIGSVIKDDVALFGLSFIDMDFVSARHPGEKSGEIVRNHHFHLVSKFSEQL